MKAKRGAGGWIVLGFILLMGTVLSQLPSSGMGTDRSALSAEDRGRRALYLTLSELGIPTRIWTNTPSELPSGGGLVWLSGVPTYPEGVSELVELETTPELAQTAIGPHDPAHYLRFMDEGGALVCALAVPDMAEFVTDELGVEIPARDFRAQPNDAAASLRFEPTGEELENLAISWFRREYVEAIEGAELVGVSVSSASDEDGSEERMASPLAGLVRVPVGRGSLLLMVSDRQFNNQRLRDADHALYATRIVEEYAGDGPVLFDEYSLGSWAPSSVMSIATAPNLLLLSVHFVLVLLIMAWYFGWVRAFSRDDVPPEPLSALARVRSRASIILRGGRPRLLAEQLRDGVLRDLYTRQKLRRVAIEGGYEVEVEELLGASVEPEEVATWVQRLAAPEELAAKDLEEFKAKLNRFSDRIQSGRVHASTQKGIM